MEVTRISRIYEDIETIEELHLQGQGLSIFYPYLPNLFLIAKSQFGTNLCQWVKTCRMTRIKDEIVSLNLHGNALLTSHGLLPFCQLVELDLSANSIKNLADFENLQAGFKKTFQDTLQKTLYKTLKSS